MNMNNIFLQQRAKQLRDDNQKDHEAKLREAKRIELSFEEWCTINGIKTSDSYCYVTRPDIAVVYMLGTGVYLAVTRSMAGQMVATLFTMANAITDEDDEIIEHFVPSRNKLSLEDVKPECVRVLRKKVQNHVVLSLADAVNNANDDLPF